MLTKTEILALDHSFQNFAANRETFKAHQLTLDSLDNIQKKHVATNILLDCSEHQLPLLKSNIQSINDDSKQKNQSFKQIILRALHITMLIYKITEEDNPAPIAYWLQKDFDASIFDEFRLLTNSLVERKSEAVLKVFTRFSDNGELPSRIMSTFKESSFNIDFSFSMIGCQNIEPRYESPLLPKLIETKTPTSPSFFPPPLNNRKTIMAVKTEENKPLVIEKSDDDSCIDGCFGFLGL